MLKIMETNFTGLGVALVTPFKPGKEVDFDALDRIVDYVIEGGVDYIVALGTTAETPTLSQSERDRVVHSVSRRIARRVPLVVGLGGNNTAEVVRLVGESDFTGIDAILSVTPFYNKPNQRGLYEHYKAVAQASPVPIILYNVPHRTGVNMLPETTLRLASDFDRIVAVKEASGKVDQMLEILAGRPKGFDVISGDDGIIVPLVEHGGAGVISVGANAFPQLFARIVDLSRQAPREAEALWGSVQEGIKLLYKDGSPAGVKCAMAFKGLLDNVVRLPLVTIEESLADQIGNFIRQNRL